MNFDGLLEKLHGFDQYYQSELKFILDELELKRKSAWKVFLIVLACAAVIVGVIYFITENEDFAIISGFLSAIVVMFCFGRIMAIRKRAKLSVMPKLCSSIGLNYHPEAMNSDLSVYSNLSLIPSYNEEKSEDEISGQIEGVDFSLFEAKLIKITRGRKGKKKRTTVFKGLLCYFDFHKEFRGTTIVSKDQTMIGNLLSGFMRSGERVKLEDPEFEDKFEVYSTDQVEARYLLTPAFMERVLQFSHSGTATNLQFAFQNGMMFMAMKNSKNHFEGDGHKLNDPKYIESTIKELAFLFEIVRDLNLTQETNI